MATVFEYLTSKGIALKDAGEVWKANCPLCEDSKEHFFINKSSGLWKCHRGSCGRSGSLSTLKSHFKDFNSVLSLDMIFTASNVKPEIVLKWETYLLSVQKLLDDAVQLEWLDVTRGLNLETVTHFKLGLKHNKFSPKNQANISWIEFPLLAGNQFVNVKFRSAKGQIKDFSFIPKAPLPLFNHDGVVKGEPIVLCEGEFDAMVLWQRGFKNVLSTTAGAGSFKPEWYDYIKSLQPPMIFIVYDTDAAGQKGAKELCSRFGGLARNIILPEGKDPTEYFLTFKHTEKEFQTLLDNTALADVEYVYSTSSIIDRAIKEIEGKVGNSLELVTPFPGVNKLIGGGFEPGELVVLTARAKIGKTTFAQYITFNMAKKSNIPVLFMCLEMRPERIVRKLICNHFNKDDSIVKVEDYLKAKEELKDIPFYFSYFWNSITMDTVEQVFTQARQRYGIKIGVFDNLHFLCRSKENLTQEIGILSKRFKVLAEKLEIPIILVVQPRRVGKDDVPSSEDLKDSSAIKADADKVLIMHRVLMKPPPDVGEQNEIIDMMTTPLEESHHPITMIKCDATRFSSGGSTTLWYDGGCSSFREPTHAEILDFKEMFSKKNTKIEGSYAGYKSRTY